MSRCPRHIICTCGFIDVKALYDEMNKLVPGLEVGITIDRAMVLILKELKRLKAIELERASE